MIKICDHEEILNSEIQKLQQTHKLQFEIFQSENKQEIQSLFDQMKNEFESQKEEKDGHWIQKVSSAKQDLERTREQLREKIKAVKALELRVSELQQDQDKSLQKLQSQIEEKQKLVECKSEEIEQMKSDTQMKISKLEREV